MKKQYIQPNTLFQPMCSLSTICVGSVKGNANMSFGGGSDGTGEYVPM